MSNLLTLEQLIISLAEGKNFCQGDIYLYTNHYREKLLLDSENIEATIGLGIS